MDSADVEDNSRCVRYFCTTGSGLEPFLVEEVKRKLSARDVEFIPGRVFFSTAAPLDDLYQLKSAERLFLSLHRSPPIQAPANHAKASAALQQSIVGDSRVWEAALCTWSRLRHRRAEEDNTTRKRKRGEEEAEVKKRKREEEVEKRKGEEEGVEEEKRTREQEVVEEKRKRGEEEAGEEKEEGRTDEQGQGHSQDVDPPEEHRPTFRVSCRSSGALARRFNPQDLSRLIGSAISKQLHWRADLRQPQLEVNVYLSDDHCVVGILLSSRPLALRSYSRHTGLRSTVAWAMTSLAHMKEGDVIMDPMCGVGSILLEAAQECPNGCFLGLDSDPGQLQRARENVETAHLQERVQLLQASAMGLPLSAGSVDVVLCDVPFGRKFSCGSRMATALPHIVKEMERVLCVGGHLVLLVSLQLSMLLKKKILHHAHAQPSPSTGLNHAHAHPSTGLKHAHAQPCPSSSTGSLNHAHAHPSPSATATTTTTTSGCPSSGSLSRDTHAHTTDPHPHPPTSTTTSMNCPHPPTQHTTDPHPPGTTSSPTTTTAVNCPSHPLSKDPRAFITHVHDRGDVLSSDCTLSQPYCTLRTHSIHKVSLGSTDAIIHTYIKTHTH